MKIRPFGKGKVRADAGVILGKRTTKVFDTKKDAELWLKGQAKVRAENRLGLQRLSTTRQQIAVRCFEELDDHELDEELMFQAVRAFCETASPDNQTLLTDAIKMLHKDMEFRNSSPVYIDQICRQLGSFARSFPGALLHQITGEMIQEWLETNCESASNRKNRRRDISVLFSKMVLKGLVKENPVDRISKVIVHRGRPDILTVDQVRSAVKHLDGEDRALFAIMTFAGLRPSEAEALDWADVDLDREFLVAKRGHGADNRNIDLSPNLVAWLRPLAFGGGQVFNGHTRRWRDRVQRAIATEATPLEVWAQDVLRHSYASYHLEKHHDATGLAHQMGHRGNTQMLYAHYRQLVTPEDALAFWEIAP